MYDQVEADEDVAAALEVVVEVDDEEVELLELGDAGTVTVPTLDGFWNRFMAQYPLYGSGLAVMCLSKRANLPAIGCPASDTSVRARASGKCSTETVREGITAETLVPTGQSVYAPI